MAIYETAIWISGSDRLPAKGLSARGWTAIPAPTPDPNDHRAVEKHFKMMRRRFGNYSNHFIGAGQSYWIAPQLLIEAGSDEVAKGAYSLINASNCVIDGCLVGDIAEEDISSAYLHRLGASAKGVEFLGKAKYLDSVSFGTYLATKASLRRTVQYAIFRLYISYRIWSSHHMNFHPTYNPRQYNVSPQPIVHATLAAALAQAYSAIEQLQLEPRPVGRDRPVKVGKAWDAAALSDLASRLEKAGLDVHEKVVWTYRGSPTRIHHTDRAPRGSKLSWTGGVVRDEDVELGDALVGASYARSKASAHKLGDLAKSLTPYDVHNVQQLARRLILAKTGILKNGGWRPLPR